MIRVVTPLLVLCALVLGLAACGDDAPASSLAGELRYVKSGGFAGDHVELVVQPSGEARLTSRRGGERSFRLSEEELAALAGEAEAMKPATDAWSQKPVPDAFVHVVHYKGVRSKTDDPTMSMSGMSALIGELQKILDAHGG